MDGLCLRQGIIETKMIKIFFNQFQLIYYTFLSDQGINI